ncbi:hypothetical protein N7509_007431 [Penicillium cosmopolitanum]|uniref:Uncharacterized protein n=1 Tax=Penicillium cosmopolitanum TaxID=1131564 RepID=A0A9X0B8F5_9EURO|nr:uncharacterized protein N7509_007431 [Penicillium cosmopolitanum]KAJ5391941.1 hypothetical protein N7509_007431 [Penicillium cosmopolitanum]
MSLPYRPNVNYGREYRLLSTYISCYSSVSNQKNKDPLVTCFLKMQEESSTYSLHVQDREKLVVKEEGIKSLTRDHQATTDVDSKLTSQVDELLEDFKSGHEALKRDFEEMD